jgi:membrane AbrB-like protein
LRNPGKRRQGHCARDWHGTSSRVSFATPPVHALNISAPIDTFLRATLCVTLAFGGGTAAAHLGVPLPYMLGAIFITMGAAIAGWPVARPARSVVLPMRIVLGVMLGSTITPELLDHLMAILGSMMVVPFFVIVATVFGFVYYHRVAGYSREESFFCAVPGGLHIMTMYAEETGVDIRRVSLAHALRITFVVILAPLAARFFVEMPDVNAVRNAATLLDSRATDLVLLAAAGLVGWLVGRSIRMPGAHMVGPMLASAALHVTGITAARPPGEAIIISQAILGAYIGSRYVGEQLSVVRDAVFFAFGHVVMMLCIGFGFAAILHYGLGVPVLTGLLSFAPGGMAEIGLIALALHLDVGFVAAIQVSRVITIALFAPYAWERLKSRIFT